MRHKMKTRAYMTMVLAVAGGIGLYALSPAFSSPLDAPPAQEEAAASPLKPAGEDPLAWDAPMPPAPAVAAEPPAAMPEPVAPAAPAIKEPVMAAEAEAAPPPMPAPVEKSAAATDTDKISALEKRVAELEEDVAALKKNRARAAAPKEDRPLAAQIKKVKKKKASAPAAPHWVLKGAKPGTAWVAEKGSTALRMVAIGDTLPGLGKITAIAKDSLGLWTVNGTQGRISQ